MAGLMDLLTARISPAYFQRQQQLEDQKQFQGLLAQYQQPQFQPVENPGLLQEGPQPATPMIPGRGGLLDPQTQQEFLMKAAAIPGYEGLANTFASNIGAGQRQTQADAAMMQRQVAQQDWRQNNQTADERLTMQQRQPLVDAQIGASNASAYANNAQGDRSAQGRQIDLGDYNRRQQMGVLDYATAKAKADTAARLQGGGGGFGDLTADKQIEARQALSTADQWAAGAADVAEWADDRKWGSGDAKARQALWQATVKPAFMEILNTGVLQGDEAEQLQKVIGDPGANVLTDANLKVIRQAAALVLDKRNKLYQAYRLVPPELGRSAGTMANNPVQPKGALKDWTPPPRAGNGSEVYSGQIQRN